MRQPVPHAFQSRHLQAGGGTFDNLDPLEFSCSEAEIHILVNGHIRDERITLEHRFYVPIGRPQVRDVAAAGDHPVGVLLFKFCGDPRQAVLPHPNGSSSVKNVPARMVKEVSVSAFTRTKFLPRCSS